MCSGPFNTPCQTECFGDDSFCASWVDRRLTSSYEAQKKENIEEADITICFVYRKTIESGIYAHHASLGRRRTDI